jgi:hypothetical protein
MIHGYLLRESMASLQCVISFGNTSRQVQSKITDRHISCGTNLHFHWAAAFGRVDIALFFIPLINIHLKDTTGAAPLYLTVHDRITQW